MKKEFTNEDFKKWLADYNFTVGQLAKVLNCSTSRLSKYKEHGANIPTIFQYALLGVLAESIKRAEKGLITQ